MLDKEVRQELRSLTKETAELVARHLVVTGQLLDVDPETALTHARAARALAGRVGAVREAGGLAAYAAQEWAEALTELRAARRISGSPEHLAVMADCERALDRPERALAYADDPDVSRLEQAARVELVIVLSGARRDMGQAEAAVLELQDPARRTKASRPWAARLWYAYADALLAAGREAEAREWFVRAAEIDAEGETDAAERLLELDGVVFEDVDDDEDWAESDSEQQRHPQQWEETAAPEPAAVAAVVAETAPAAVDAPGKAEADARDQDDEDAGVPADPVTGVAASVPSGAGDASAVAEAATTEDAPEAPAAAEGSTGAAVPGDVPVTEAGPDTVRAPAPIAQPAFTGGGEEPAAPPAPVPGSDAVPGVSFQAPDGGTDGDEELRLFD